MDVFSLASGCHGLSTVARVLCKSKNRRIVQELDERGLVVRTLLLEDTEEATIEIEV